MKKIRPLRPPEDDALEGMALDGKILRGSRQQGASHTHVLAALSHRLGMIVAGGDR